MGRELQAPERQGYTGDGLLAACPRLAVHGVVPLGARPAFEGGPPRGRVAAPIATELYALPETAEDDFDAFERRNVAAHADAACALRGLRAALLELLACQHGASARDRAACDAGVTARVNAAAPCVGERARAALMRARDGVSSARG